VRLLKGILLRGLIFFFVELCLLRRAPQDLPAASALLALGVVADVLVGLLLGLIVDLSPWMALSQGLVDVAFMLAVLYVALRLMDRLRRFMQTATALLGAGAVLGTLAIVPLSLLPVGGEGEPTAIAAILFLGLIVWSVLVTGHIFRHAFDLRLGQGVVIAVAYNLLSYSLVGGIFSGS
jgi:hypothetical protein